MHARRIDSPTGFVTCGEILYVGGNDVGAGGCDEWILVARQRGMCRHSQRISKDGRQAASLSSQRQSSDGDVQSAVRPTTHSPTSGVTTGRTGTRSGQVIPIVDTGDLAGPIERLPWLRATVGAAGLRLRLAARH